MDRAASRQHLAANAAPGDSRLPRPGLRGKRAAAADENAPPEPQKRARTGPAPGPKAAAASQAASAAPGGSRPRAAPAAPRGLLLRVSGRRRSSARATIAALPAAPSAGLNCRAALGAPPKPGPPAAPAGGRERKRAPWDLKGQISDLQAKVGAYKERAQGLAGENEALKSQLGGLRQELTEATGRNGELSGRASLLASELQLCRDQARESGQKVSELLEKEERLEERCQSQAQRIGQLEALNREVTEGSREQAVRLKARESALDGYHVCIFAYGQTGSGKTYTMEGPDDPGPETAGMIPRAVRQIFAASRDMEAKGWKYQFTANFLEIYNESLRDLLVLRPEQNGELEIRRVSQLTEELHVPNLSCIPVSSEEEVWRLLLTAKAHRSVARTNLNERSSRSHSLFQLRVEGTNTKRGLHTSSVLSLVDLAGSERLDKSLSTGERLKETQAINTSLSTLSLVITALSNKDAHIPYRNSKLTYLLQNSLGGSSKMLMFVNISPLEENFAESLNSLRFARKVNECVIGTASSNRK